MGKKYVCSLCGCNAFKVFSNVYVKDVVSVNHYEIVCDNCNFGFVVEAKPIILECESDLM